MGRAARGKWNRRLHRLAQEEAERRRCAREKAERPSPFSPVSFWVDWFHQTAKAAEGPAFVLRVLCNGAVGGDASPMRAADWWPEPIDRAAVEELKARLQNVEDTRTGTAAVAFVELLAET